MIQFFLNFFKILFKNILFFLIYFFYSNVTNISYAFVIDKIRIYGLKHINSNNILHYFSNIIGKNISFVDLNKINNKLNYTGLFQFVSLKKINNILLVRLIEKSVIRSVSIFGSINSIDINLIMNLQKKLGIIKGSIFNSNILLRFKKDFEKILFFNEKYNLYVKYKIQFSKINYVDIKFFISSKPLFLIRKIRFIGNSSFSERKLLFNFNIFKEKIFGFLGKRNRFSIESIKMILLNVLKVIYINNGYIKFKVLSININLLSDKRSVSVKVVLYEGKQYRFSGFSFFEKNNIISFNKMIKIINVKRGNIFSWSVINNNIILIKSEYSKLGYEFSDVGVIFNINDRDKLVFVIFDVSPGRRMYIRKIRFHGNKKTADYVLRNMMVHSDFGKLLSLYNIRESEKRIKSLGYINNVYTKISIVKDSKDQVDIDIYIKESSSKKINCSIGYGLSGLQLNLFVQELNLFGSGNLLSFKFNNVNYSKDYFINYINPFYKSKIEYGVNLYCHRESSNKLDVFSYRSDKFGFDLNFNIFLNKKSDFKFGFGYENLGIKHVRKNMRYIQRFIDMNGKDFNQFRIFSNLLYHSYDREIFPTSGLDCLINLLLSFPIDINSLFYYKIDYKGQWYINLGKGFIFFVSNNIGYGNSFDKHDSLPFFENYYAGGISKFGQVRGYEVNSLGPKDDSGKIVGGNLLIGGSFNLIFPYPFTNEKVRSSVFLDIGEVFSYKTFKYLSGKNYGYLRYSSGLSVEWKSPFGLVMFSLATPLNKYSFDQCKFFQFSMLS
ncbi:outer membrane protein assembly factor BamA [Candidatus Legionella polyplacis]|uniref:outer membrane protein assembly factor BamA n=1 Tax=Candidatus Legionella polyplacis TaxID=2005262 RepID=UPI000C1F6D3C|nr:outer membrane protein assembly factor BamA [Candidatus Legionella polyplacis]ATW01955.1 outer membrane protein assembly factor BamA [Candidatus Legionella polyplacis]